MVEIASHGEEVAVGVGKGGIDGGTVIVESRTFDGVGYIDVEGCALHFVEHEALHGKGTGSIEYDQGEIGPVATEGGLGSGDFGSQLGKEEGFVKVVVKHAAQEVVG